MIDITTLGVSATNTTATATTVTLTTGTGILAGDTVIVMLSYGGTNSDVVSSVSDGTNTYTKVMGGVGDGVNINGYSGLYLKSNCAAVSSGATLTGTFTTNTNRFITAVRIGGLTFPDAPLDTQPAAVTTGSTSSPSVSTGALAREDEVLIGGLCANSNPTVTGASGWTTLQQITHTDNNRVFNFAYIVNTAARTTVAFNPTRNASSGNIIHVLSLKAGTENGFFR